MAKNPEAQEKLYQEIQSVLGDCTEPTPEDISKMPYLKGCMMESFRCACVWYILNKGTCRSFQICTDKLKHITDHMRSAILLIDHAQFSPHVLGRLSSMNSEIVVEFCSDIYAASL